MHTFTDNFHQGGKYYAQMVILLKMGNGDNCLPLVNSNADPSAGPMSKFWVLSDGRQIDFRAPGRANTGDRQTSERPAVQIANYDSII